MIDTELLLRVIDLGVGTISLVATIIMAVVLLRMVKVVTFALEGQHSSDESDSAERKGLIGMIETLIVKWGSTLDVMQQAIEKAGDLAQQRFEHAMKAMSEVPVSINILLAGVTDAQQTTLKNHKLLISFREQLEEIKQTITDMPTSKDLLAQKAEIQALIARVETDCDRLEVAITKIEERTVKKEHDDEPGHISERVGDDPESVLGLRVADPGFGGECSNPGPDRGLHDLANQVGTAGHQMEQPDVQPAPGDHSGNPE